MNIRVPSSQRRENGVAVIVVLALLSILLLYVAANVRSLHQLGRELKLIEQKQIHRLNATAGVTNSAAAQLPVVTTGVTVLISESPPQPTLR